MKFFSLILITIGSFFMSGCGISEYIYLVPPLDSSASTSSFSLVTSPQQKPELVGGIELYYKIYSSSSSIDSSYDNDYDYISKASVSSLKSSLSSRGYHRIMTPNDDKSSFSYPSIPLTQAQRSQRVTININFSGETPNVYINEEYINLLRSVWDESLREHKKFSNFDIHNDKDLQNIKNDSNPYYYIGMFSMAYANSNFEEVYSNIAKLGYIYKNK